MRRSGENIKQSDAKSRSFCHYPSLTSPSILTASTDLARMAAMHNTEDKGEDLGATPIQTAAQRRRAALEEVDEAKFSVCPPFSSR